jgi:predicted TPR repeat methyltransferase
MDFFDRQWSTYRAVLEADLMEHRGLAQAIESTLNHHLSQRQASAPAPHMVDLGCGDLGLLAPMLRNLPLGSFTGLDLTAKVLPLAQAALGAVAYPCQWRLGDLLHWAHEPGEPESIDILLSSFAIHHLTAEQKEEFLSASRQKMAPKGIFLWADVFREPGEEHAPYIARYAQRIRDEWAIDPHQKAMVIDHITSFDIPADRTGIEATARACGWDWQWLWQGQHQAEAMALLTPS